MSGTPSTPNASLSAWQTAVEQYDPPFARQLQESTNPYAEVAALGLPVPRYVMFATIGDFLADQKAGLLPLQQEGITNFYVGARTAIAGLSNFRNAAEALPAEKIAPFIQERVTPDLYDKFGLRIAEFLVGVCVVAEIDRQGVIELDIAEGTLPPLTSGYKTPDFTASNEPTDKNKSGVLLYYDRVATNQTGELPAAPLPVDETSLLNTAVRTAIWKALSMIPQQAVESDVRKPRLPGKYEFAIVNHAGVLLPIFADAQLTAKSHRDTLIPSQS